MTLRSPLSRRAFLPLLGAALLSLGAAPRAAAQDGPSLVILVRHAEKAAEPANDPPLTPAGAARAQALVEALGATKPSAIIVSATKRTGETAAPLAAKHGLTPQVVSLTGGGAAHVNAVAEAVRKARGVVVVVGHSNTVPAIIRALGGPALPDICDAHYANLFVLQPARGSEPASLVRASFGVADAPGAPGCAAMTPAR
jgi:broad specificity phosphatase PhoE